MHFRAKRFRQKRPRFWLLYARNDTLQRKRPSMAFRHRSSGRRQTSRTFERFSGWLLGSPAQGARLSIPAPEPVAGPPAPFAARDRALRRACRSEEHTSELQSLAYLVCRLLLEKKKKKLKTVLTATTNFESNTKCDRITGNKI